MQRWQGCELLAPESKDRFGSPGRCPTPPAAAPALLSGTAFACVRACSRVCVHVVVHATGLPAKASSQTARRQPKPRNDRVILSPCYPCYPIYSYRLSFKPHSTISLRARAEGICGTDWSRATLFRECWQSVHRTPGLFCWICRCACSSASERIGDAHRSVGRCCRPRQNFAARGQRVQ